MRRRASRTGKEPKDEQTRHRSTQGLRRAPTACGLCLRPTVFHALGCNNVESQKLQYGFAEQAAQLGWSRERIIVVDEDQGQSGALPQARGGFGGMVAAFARGEVCIVMSFELSRLSRNDLDWHHLVYLCRWTSTLIADEQGLYDPSSTNDRMVLGIRGQVSELESDSLVHRMVEARWNKARRGEAFTIPPASFRHSTSWPPYAPMSPTPDSS